MRAHIEHDTSLRRTTHADAPAIERLAALDSADVPERPVFVAEAGGRIVAVVGADGAAVADPFLPTAGSVAALRVLVREMERRPRMRLRMRPAPRRAAA